MLLNLLGNAIKYTVNGWVELRVSLQNEALLFEVRDSGIGIAESDLQQVFEPFKQVHQSLQFGGSGLGLSISRRLVDAMGGVLQLDSKLGRGSRFYFALPYVTGSNELLNSHETHNENSIYVRLPKEEQYLMVLVVASTPYERELFSDLLSAAGFQVCCVESISKAVESVSNSAFALVIIDMLNTDNACSIINNLRKKSLNLN